MEQEELNTHTHQRLNRIGAVAMKSVLILLAVLAVYLVLFPVVVYLGFKLEILNILDDHPIIEAAGAPLEWFAGVCPPYSVFLEFLSRFFFEAGP